MQHGWVGPETAIFRVSDYRNEKPARQENALWMQSLHNLVRLRVNLNPLSYGARIRSMTLINPLALRMPSRFVSPLSMAMLLCLLSVVLPARAQSVNHGRMVFESQCMKCHRLDTNYQGPALRTVVGRTAGKAPDYFYSEALESATHVWDVAKLKSWLTNPESVVPGQEMNFHLDSARDREDVVAFLVAQRHLAVPALAVCQPGPSASKNCSKSRKETTP